MKKLSCIQIKLNLELVVIKNGRFRVFHLTMIHDQLVQAKNFLDLMENSLKIFDPYSKRFFVVTFSTISKYTKTIHQTHQATSSEIAYRVEKPPKTNF